MILKYLNAHCTTDAINKKMPATYENGTLKIGHHGFSKGVKTWDNLDKFIGKEEEFQFLGMDEYVEYQKPNDNYIFDRDWYTKRNTFNLGLEERKVDVPYFLYHGKLFKLIHTPWYSYLVSVNLETMHCQCEDCGKQFIISFNSIKYYKRHSLQLPIVRCRECIPEKKKNRVRKYKEKYKEKKTSSLGYGLKSFSSYVDEQVFQERYRCKCGEFKGLQFRGETCPLCHTKIESRN